MAVIKTFKPIGATDGTLRLSLPTCHTGSRGHT
jgi:hypothetical protein